MAYKLGKAIAQTISEHTALSANQVMGVRMDATTIQITYARHAGTHIEIRECSMTTDHQRLIYDDQAGVLPVEEAGEIDDNRAVQR
jgi:hypothetical protein